MTMPLNADVLDLDFAHDILALALTLDYVLLASRFVLPSFMLLCSQNPHNIQKLAVLFVLGIMSTGQR